MRYEPKFIYVLFR